MQHFVAVLQSFNIEVLLLRLTWERLIDLQQQHLDSQRRSVVREEPMPMQLTEDSIGELAELIPIPSAGP